MTELSNPLYGSLRHSAKCSPKKQCITLQEDFVLFFGEIAALSTSDVINATHQARKALKSYRAFVKLLKKCPGVQDYKEANYLLRDLGKEFSDMRDSHVRHMLLSELNGKLQLNFLRTFINKNSEEVEVKEKVLLSDPNHFDGLKRTISQSTVLQDLFDKADIQPSCIKEGLSSSFNKSEAAYIDCSNLITEDAFHEWRKRLKDLLNILKLFKNEQVLLSNEQYSQMNELCEEMGLLNDMAMLKEWIEENESAWNDPQEHSGIVSFLDDKISGFQQRLLTAGEHFYMHSDKTLDELKILYSDEQ